MWRLFGLLLLVNLSLPILGWSQPKSPATDPKGLEVVAAYQSDSGILLVVFDEHSIGRYLTGNPLDASHNTIFMGQLGRLRQVESDRVGIGLFFDDKDTPFPGQIHVNDWKFRDSRVPGGIYRAQIAGPHIAIEFAGKNIKFTLVPETTRLEIESYVQQHQGLIWVEPEQELLRSYREERTGNFLIITEIMEDYNNPHLTGKQVYYGRPGGVWRLKVQSADYDLERNLEINLTEGRKIFAPTPEIAPFEPPFFFDPKRGGKFNLQEVKLNPDELLKLGVRLYNEKDQALSPLDLLIHTPENLKYLLQENRFLTSACAALF